MTPASLAPGTEIGPLDSMPATAKKAASSPTGKYGHPESCPVARVLPTPPGAPSGSYHLIGIADGVPVDRLSAHTKVAGSLILHVLAPEVFSQVELAQIVAGASTDRPPRWQLRLLDALSLRLGHAEIAIGRSHDA